MFIADDFGWDTPTNEAVIRAHRSGVLCGASLMMGQPATEAAIRLARENSGLQVGWHLHLCDSRPVTVERWPWDSSPSRAGFEIFFSPAGRRLMRKEIEIQWDLFQKTGLECSFVNAHHHLHIHPSVYSCLMRVLPESFRGWIRMGQPSFFAGNHRLFEFGIISNWVRLFRKRRCVHRFSDSLWGVDRLFRMNAGEIAGAIHGLQAGLHEFMFHPRNVDSDPDFLALLELKAMGF